MEYFVLTIVLAPIVVLLFIYPWLSIAMLLLAPIMKPGMEFYVPVLRTVDLTVLVCALSGTAGIAAYLRRGDSGSRLSLPWAQLSCMLVLGAAMLVGLFWTTGPDYGGQKTVSFMGIGIPFLLLPAFLVRSEKDAMRTITTVIVVGTLAAVAMIINPTSEVAALRFGRGYGRGTLFGSDANTPAIIISTGVLAYATVFVVKAGVSKAIARLALIALPLGLVAVLVSGSRASMLGLIGGGMMLPLLAGRGGRGKGVFIFSILIPATLLVVMLFFAGLPGIGGDRWRHFFSLAQDPTGETSLAGTRSVHFAFCLQNAWDQPFMGHGPGSFGVDCFQLTSPLWPHNIVLEALYENGLIGMVALLMFLLVTARIGVRGLRLTRSGQERMLVVVPIIMFIFMMVPGLTHWSLEGIRLLYLYAGLVHAVSVQIAAVAEQQAFADSLEAGETSFYPV
jgi:O-antigen ligase